MYKIYPYFTNDGSVGLFSPEADDIYHSSHGALTEAWEKFVLPIKNLPRDIKILDICFGIGYNTKSFLEFLTNYATIDADNISKFNLHIDAVDVDKNLAYLSPFFVTGKKNFKNNVLDFDNDKITRYLNGKTEPKYKLSRETNIVIYELLRHCEEDFLPDEAAQLLCNRKYSIFYDNYIVNLHKRGFLHNIYYRNISRSYKKAVKCLKNNNITLNLIIDDARNAVKNSKEIYNYIFLDAFTPKKCPELWSVEFFKSLYEHLAEGGMVLTYSRAGNVREAFEQARFHVERRKNGMTATRRSL
ncbi:MAG: hypothetical protein LBJ74_03080 [Heliobacteriaceae bacterium]|jgi:tRNA U34 5-methylaminomethyl-2-thiouridine-forming methyltransferase MnmC|nr:hypothetical protein [Heliobacteriaceae bacterium]